MELRYKAASNLAHKIKGVIVQILRTYQKHFLIAGLAILLILISFFLSLNWIIEKQITRYQSKFQTTYNADLRILGLKVSGFNSISIQKLEIQVKDTPPLLTLNNIKLQLKLLPMFLGKAKINSLSLNKGTINYFQQSNLDNTLKAINNNNETLPASTSLHENILGKFIRYKHYLPTEIQLQNVNLNYQTTSDTIKFEGFYLSLANQQLETRVSYNKHPFSALGYFNPSSLEMDLKANFERGVNLALLQKIKKMGVYLTSPNFELKSNNIDLEKDEASLNFEINTPEIAFYHRRISRDTLIFNNIKTQWFITSNENEFSIDSSSCIEVNNLKLHPFLQINLSQNQTKQAIDTIITGHINIPNQEAQNIIYALPKNGFQTLEGLKLHGQLEYKFGFTCPLGNPDSLKLISELKPHKLNIKKYGKCDFRYINNHFIYHPFYSNRKIDVSPNNSAFTPYVTVPKMLIQAIINAEDGSFFYHNGFNFAALTQSAIEDLKTKSFRRGGSTISMQLVKNVFLNHQKTIIRKIEEAIIVWMIEHWHLVSKQRMMEIYVNVIEWGPNIFGIGEASQFYFYKQPHQLELEECIFLAMIISHPRSFAYHFDPKTGYLASNNKSFFELIAHKMLIQKVINQSQFDQLSLENIALSANARRYIGMEDSAQRFTKKEAHNRLLEVIKKGQQAASESLVLPDEDDLNQLREE